MERNGTVNCNQANETRMGEREQRILELTKNLDRVDEVSVDVIADLTDIIARILRCNVGYYEIIPVQAVPRVPAYDDVRCCQHICSASPQHNVISCSRGRAAPWMVVVVVVAGTQNKWKGDAQMEAIRETEGDHRITREQDSVAVISALLCLPTFSTWQGRDKDSPVTAR